MPLQRPTPRLLDRLNSFGKFTTVFIHTACIFSGWDAAGHHRQHLMHDLAEPGSHGVLQLIRAMVGAHDDPHKLSSEFYASRARRTPATHAGLDAVTKVTSSQGTSSNTTSPICRRSHARSSIEGVTSIVVVLAMHPRNAAPAKYREWNSPVRGNCQSDGWYGGSPLAFWFQDSAYMSD